MLRQNEMRRRAANVQFIYSSYSVRTVVASTRAVAPGAHFRSIVPDGPGACPSNDCRSKKLRLIPVNLDHKRTEVKCWAWHSL